MKKIAVIGLGNISNRHRKNLKQLYPKSIICAMSASGKAPKDIIDNVDCILGSIDEVISFKPEMAIVASPATFHALHSLPLIEAGIPVLIEKPLSASISDAKKIFSAAEEYQVPVAIGYCLRYLSSSKKMKDLLETKTIGKIHNVSIEAGQYLPDWRPNKDYRNSVSASAYLGGGVLLELSHEIDYMQWLMGQMLPKYAILKFSNELELNVEESADILSINDDGVVVSIHLDFLQRQPFRKARFIGNRGTLEWDLIGNRIVLNTKDHSEILFEDIGWDSNQMYLNMIVDFENLIYKKPNQCITTLEAMNTVIFISDTKALNERRI